MKWTGVAFRATLRVLAPRRAASVHMVVEAAAMVAVVAIQTQPKSAVTSNADAAIEVRTADSGTPGQVDRAVAVVAVAVAVVSNCTGRHL